MNSTGFFVWAFTGTEQPIISVTQAIMGALSAYAAPVLKYAIIAYVAGRMIMMAYSPQGAPLNEFLKLLFKCAIAYWIVASAANYNQYFGTVLQTTLPVEITHAVSGHGGPPLTAQSFDDIWNKAFVGGEVVMRNLPLSFKAIALGIFVIIYWIASLICIGAAFAIYWFSFIAIAVLVSVGILFAALFPFVGTRHYFNAWISTALAMVLLQIFVVVLLAIMVGSVNTLMAQIAQGGMGSLNGNEIDQIKMLLAAILIFVLSAFVALQLPGLAAGCARGFCADVGVFGAAVMGGMSGGSSLLGWGGGMAASGAGSMARGSVSAIERMSGPSLSGNP